MGEIGEGEETQLKEGKKYGLRMHNLNLKE